MSGKTGRPSRAPRIADTELEELAPDSNPPPPGTLAYQLWEGTVGVATQALGTEYIQGIGENALDPNDYGHYTIQDVAYCAGAVANYATMEVRAQGMGFPDLATFAQARQRSYETYAASLNAAWHIGDPSGVAPGPAATYYLELETFVANQWHPIYGIVVMIPCYKLWAYLANQLAGRSPSGNLYQFWIDANLDWNSAYRMDNFLNSWVLQHPGVADPESCMSIYKAAMLGELRFFESATGQTISPLQLPAQGDEASDEGTE